MNELFLTGTLIKHHYSTWLPSTVFLIITTSIWFTSHAFLVQRHRTENNRCMSPRRYKCFHNQCFIARFVPIASSALHLYTTANLPETAYILRTSSLTYCFCHIFVKYLLFCRSHWGLLTTLICLDSLISISARKVSVSCLFRNCLILCKYMYCYITISGKKTCYWK